MTPDPGLASWLQLSLTPGLGASTIRSLLKQFGLPEAMLDRPHSELARAMGPPAFDALRSARVKEAVERALQWASQEDHFVITLADDTYPRSLLEISDPPAQGTTTWSGALQPSCSAISNPNVFEPSP